MPRALLAAALLFSAAALAEPTSSERHLLAAQALYQQLEYERALEELAQARQGDPGADDRVAISLYEGVLYAELGRRDESKAAFTTALFERPDATLPGKVSPKVQSDFDGVKADVTARLSKGVSSSGYRLSATVSTLPQLVPLRSVEAQIEYRLADRLGVAGNVGFLFGQSSSFWVGGQARFYLLGTFDHGLPVGVQLTLANVAGVGSGLMIGPFAGYKLALGNGFTFDGRLGLMWAPGATALPNWPAPLFPIFNLNVGWSLFGNRLAP